MRSCPYFVCLHNEKKNRGKTNIPQSNMVLNIISIMCQILTFQALVVLYTYYICSKSIVFSSPRPCVNIMNLYFIVAMMLDSSNEQF